MTRMRGSLSLSQYSIHALHCLNRDLHLRIITLFCDSTTTRSIVYTPRYFTQQVVPVFFSS